MEVTKISFLLHSNTLKTHTHTHTTSLFLLIKILSDLRLIISLKIGDNNSV